MSENTILYVSPSKGKDNSGLGTKDSPIASIKEALRRISCMQNCNQVQYPVTIKLSAERHFLPATLDISVDYPLTITSAEKRPAILDGGVAITGWKPVTINGKKALKTKVDFPVEQLYWGDKLLSRASFPKGNKFYRCQNRPAQYVLFESDDRFIAEPGSFNPKWHNINGINVMLIHKWHEINMPVEGYDKSTGEIICARNTVFQIVTEDGEYKLENVREALLEPGEFYYDSTDSTVTMIPPKGFKLDGEMPIAPRLGCLLMVKNSRFLTLENLSFVHGGAYFPEVGKKYGIHGYDLPNYSICYNVLHESPNGKQFGGTAQAACSFPGMLFFDHSRDCIVKNCEIKDGGWYGIEAGAGCSNLNFTDNEIHHIGCGGIRIGGAPAQGPVEDQTSRISVINNHLHDLGQIYLSGAGILITHAYGNLLEHNHIHDLYYSGIACGWVWGFVETVTRENRIGWNRIHDLGKGILSDMGGIYLLGVQPGTRVYNNCISDITCRYYGGWGLYTDEGSSHMVLENNISYNCNDCAYTQHFGRENILRYNIFVNGSMRGVVNMGRALNEPPYNEVAGIFPGKNASNTLSCYKNVIISSGEAFYSSNDLRNLVAPTFWAENNLLWCTDSKKTPKVAKEDFGQKQELSLEEWQKRGFDLNSVFADPKFTNFKKHDFSFGKNSPLVKMGFQPIDMSKFGQIKK